MNSKKLLYSRARYAVSFYDDVMPVPRHWHPVFLCSSIKKSAFVFTNLVGSQCLGTGMTRRGY
ncbi:MAG: hypothetical protein ACR5LA_02930 [Wolbachia sp.]